MSPEVHSLVSAARGVQGTIPLTDDLTAGAVAAALLTRTGRIFTGICLDLTCGLGFCAERAAMAEMLKSRETEVLLMVAVTKSAILPPCGCCREALVQIDKENLNTGIVLGENRVIPLGQLLPEHWLVF